MKKYDKLVHDSIPKIIRDTGQKCTTRKIKGKELTSYLSKKVIEEVTELFDDPCAEEFADVIEILEAYRRHVAISIEDVLEAKYKKHKTRGGFQKGIVLLEVSD